MACAWTKFMKEGAVVVRGIDEAIASWHVYSVGARDVVSAHLRWIVQMESRAIGPPGDDGLAGLVLLYRRSWLSSASRSAGRVRPSHCSTLKTV